MTRCIRLVLAALVVVVVALPGGAASSTTLYTVSQEFGNDNLGYVLVQDAEIRGSSTITIRLDLLAVVGGLSSTQTVTVERCTFYGTSNLVLQGPNRAASNPSLYGDVTLRVFLRDVNFMDGNTGVLLTGALRNAVVVVERCTFSGSTHPPSMHVYSSHVLSQYARTHNYGPRVLLSDLSLESNSILRIVASSLQLSSSGSAVGILVDSSSSAATAFGLELKAGSAVVVERCQMVSSVGGVASLWFQTAAIAVRAFSALQFKANVGTLLVGGSLVAAISLGSLVDVLPQPKAANGEATPITSTLDGFLLMDGNTFHAGTSSGSVVVIDLDQLEASSVSTILLLSNTISIVDDGGGGQVTARCPNSGGLGAAVRLPGYVNHGILSIGKNDISDLGAVPGTCTDMVFVTQLFGAFQLSTSKYYVQCNTYNGAAPWAPASSGPSLTYTITMENSCDPSVCFEGNCADLSVSSASAPCSCACSSGQADKQYCSNVDIHGLLGPVQTITKTRTVVMSPSPHELTLTRTTNISTSPEQVSSNSVPLSRSRTVGPLSESRDHHASNTNQHGTPTSSASPQPSSSVSPTEASSLTAGSASFTTSPSSSVGSLSSAGSPTLSLSPPSPEVTASTSKTSSPTAPKTHTLVSFTISGPTPSSDTTITSTETQTITHTRTQSNRTTPTASPLTTTTLSLSVSSDITTTATEYVGGHGQYFFNGTADSFTMSLSRTVTSSRTFASSSVSDDATRHMALTFSATEPKASGSPSASPTPTVSVSRSKSNSETGTQRSSTKWFTMSVTSTFSGDGASASNTLSDDDTRTLFTWTESITRTSSISLSGAPSLTATPSALFRSNSSSTSTSWSTELSNTKSTSRTASVSASTTTTIGSYSMEPSSSMTLSASSSNDKSLSLTGRSASPDFSASPTRTRSTSLSRSESPEIASMSNTKRPVPTKTITVSSDDSFSFSLTPTSDVSATGSMLPTPTESFSNSASMSSSGSRTLTETETRTFTRSLPSISGDLSSSCSLSETITTSHTLSLPTASDEPTRTSTDSISSSNEGSRSGSRSSSLSKELASSTATLTETTTTTVDASHSASNDRHASTTVTGSASRSRSASSTVNRDGPWSFSLSASHSRLRITDTNSSTPSCTQDPASTTETLTLSTSKSIASPTFSFTKEFPTASESVTFSQSVSVSRTRNTRSETPTWSVNSPSVILSMTTTISDSVTATATDTIRRSFSRHISRSGSVSAEGSRTESVEPTSTRTFHFPHSNLAAANLFAQFQARASTCVQLMVYILFPLGILLVLHVVWNVRVWWTGRGFAHVSVDTYRTVSPIRSLLALHTYISMFYPCHVRCALIHSLQGVCYITTWSAILLVLIDRLGTDNITLRAMCCLLTLLIAQVVKPIMNVLGFYYHLEDAEDNYTAGGGANGFMSIIAEDGHRQGVELDGGNESDIDFDMDEEEWERYRADRTQLFQERLREEDIDIADDGDVVKEAGSSGRAEDDIDLVFEEDGMHKNADGNFSFLTSGEHGAPTTSSSARNITDSNTHDSHRSKTKEHRKKKNKTSASTVTAAATEGTTTGNSHYGFGELDNFVLFHDDFTSFQKRGHQLRLQQYADDHAEDALVAFTAAPTSPHHDDGDGRTPRRGDAAPSVNGDDQGTLTSSCVSIDVDDDEDEDGVGGILALGPLSGGGGIDNERDDDELSISDPRVLRTLHRPYLAGLVGLLAVDIWVITGLYRNQENVCSSWVFTLWWVTWLVDLLVAETLYLLAVVLWRYLIREPHEEDVHGRARRYLNSEGGKRDLRWWKGNLLHPYEGETRYR